MRAFPIYLLAGLLLCLAGTSARAQKLACSPCSYDFGSVTIGQSGSYSIHLSNSSTQTITISSKSVTGAAFSYGSFPLPAQVAPWSTIVLPINFTPAAAGSASGVFTIVSNALNSPLTVDVSGTGVGSATNVELAVSPSKLSFGKVSVGSSATLQATLTASNGRVTISSDSSTKPEFTIAGLKLPVTIAAGNSLSVTIQFAPTSSGAHNAKLGFTSDATNSPTVETVTGTGTAAAGGTLAISPATLSFGNVTVGSNASLQATLTASNAAVTISSGSSTSPEFAVTAPSLPVTIPAGTSIPVTIQFAPNSSGADPAQVGFTSDATNSPTVETVTGTGVAQASHYVSLAWNVDGSAVGYNVFRGTSKNGPYQQINTALEASANYTDSTVTSGTTYYYATTAVNAQGQESVYSNVVKAVVPQ